ncbi:MAG: alpha/beta hydrolase fold domain-containing protein, partial [Chloroflexi bacterium]|nr:alpha/beta hydrolase fold domain-containing protein [Chloroflexota bacterium]
FGAKLTARITGMLGFEMPAPTHWQKGVTVQDAMMRALLGGTPDEVPETYQAASPVTYAGPGCPPTMLLQGEHDAVTSAEAVRVLAGKLEEAGVPVVNIEYPQTEHAFDLILPKISPPAQAALYEVERFLALME